MSAELTWRAHDQPPLFAVPEPRSPDIELGDWITLFCAVTARLRQTAAGQSTVTKDGHALEASGRLRSEVLDCVTALDQLHDMLSQALDRQRGLERQFQTLRAELEAVRRGVVMDDGSGDAQVARPVAF